MMKPETHAPVKTYFDDIHTNTFGCEKLSKVKLCLCIFNLSLRSNSNMKGISVFITTQLQPALVLGLTFQCEGWPTGTRLVTGLGLRHTGSQDRTIVKNLTEGCEK